MHSTGNWKMHEYFSLQILLYNSPFNKLIIWEISALSVAERKRERGGGSHIFIFLFLSRQTKAELINFRPASRMENHSNRLDRRCNLLYRKYNDAALNSMLNSANIRSTLTSYTRITLAWLKSSRMLRCECRIRCHCITLRKSRYYLVTRDTKRGRKTREIERKRIA